MGSWLVISMLYVIGFDINTLPEFGERGYKTFA